MLRKIAIKLCYLPWLDSFRAWVKKLLAYTSYWRALPACLGHRKLYVTPSSTLEYILPFDNCFDTELLDVVDKFITSSMCVWDVGANVGVFSVGAAHRAKSGSVLAIEADPYLATLMRRTIEMRSNADLNIRVLCTALSFDNDIEFFLLSDRGRCANHLSKTRAGWGEGYVSEMPVTTVSLDSLLRTFHAPDFIKIDIESGELHALLGAKKMLSQIRPVIYIEVDPRFRAVVSGIFLDDYGYLLYNAQTLERLTLCQPNTLAIPKEKVTWNPKTLSIQGYQRQAESR